MSNALATLTTTRTITVTSLILFDCARETVKRNWSASEAQWNDPVLDSFVHVARNEMVHISLYSTIEKSIIFENADTGVRRYAHFATEQDANIAHQMLRDWYKYCQDKREKKGVIRPRPVTFQIVMEAEDSCDVAHLSAGSEKGE